MPIDTLIVDDEPAIRAAVNAILRDYDYDCTEAFSTADAREILSCATFDIAFVDIMMPGETGIGLVRTLREEHPETAVVMLTGVADPGVAKDVLDLGVYGYLLKPIVANQLVITAQNALRRRDLERATKKHIEQLERIVADRAEALELTELRLQAVEGSLRRTGMSVDVILEAVTEPVIIISATGRVSNLNSAARSLLGLETESGLVVDPVEWAALRSRLAKGYDFTKERLSLFKNDDSFVEVTVSALPRLFEDEQPYGAVLFVHRDDSNEDGGAMDELWRSGELEQLTASMIEVVDSCTYYSGLNTAFLKQAFADLQGLLELDRDLIANAASHEDPRDILERLEKGRAHYNLSFLVEEIPNTVSKTLKAIERISSVVHVLQDIRERGPAFGDGVTLDDIIGRTLDAGSQLWHRVADVDYQPTSNGARVLGARHLISRVLLNLLLYCRDAIAPRVLRGFSQRGRISVTTRDLERDVALTIRHTGGRLPPELSRELSAPWDHERGSSKLPTSLQRARELLVGELGCTLVAEETHDDGTEITVVFRRAGSPPIS